MAKKTGVSVVAVGMVFAVMLFYLGSSSSDKEIPAEIDVIGKVKQSEQDDQDFTPSSKVSSYNELERRKLAICKCPQCPCKTT